MAANLTYRVVIEPSTKVFGRGDIAMKRSLTVTAHLRKTLLHANVVIEGLPVRHFICVQAFECYHSLIGLFEDGRAPPRSASQCSSLGSLDSSRNDRDDDLPPFAYLRNSLAVRVHLRICCSPFAGG